MPVKIDSRFPTPEETAEIFGVPAKRARELRKMVDASINARRTMGIAWVAPASARSALRAASVKKRAAVTPLDGAATTKSERSRISRRADGRGKKTKTAR
jgi:hypothetical protein